MNRNGISVGDDRLSSTLGWKRKDLHKACQRLYEDRLIKKHHLHHALKEIGHVNPTWSLKRVDCIAPTT
jgi:transcription initiation factor IIE alpha subunit